MTPAQNSWRMMRIAFPAPKSCRQVDAKHDEKLRTDCPDDCHALTGPYIPLSTYAIASPKVMTLAAEELVAR